MTTTDEQLLVEFNATRSPAALDELVGRHLGAVRNLAFRMVLCDATADDVTQDVFVKMMHHAGSFRGEAKFSTWLYRIAMNTAKEHLRRQRAVQKIDDGDRHVASPDHDRAERQAMDHELAAKVEHALARLSTKLRAAVVLTAIECLSAKEAAAIEGCSTATMHWRIHQARKRLKLLLYEYFK